MPVERGAQVYQRAGNLYISSESKTEAGFWIHTPPYIAILADGERDEVGRRLREAFDASESSSYALTRGA